MQEVLLAVRRWGYKIPLKITLIIKNLLALDKLSRKAGFKGMIEAFFFTP